jgi:hypothetical protein
MRLLYPLIFLIIFAIGFFSDRILAAGNNPIDKCECEEGTCEIIIKTIENVDLMDIATKDIQAKVPSIVESPIPLKFNTNLHEVEKAIKFKDVISRTISMTKELPPLISMEITIDGHASQNGTWFPLSLFQDVSEEAEYKLKTITYSLSFGGKTAQSFTIDVDAKDKMILVTEIIEGLNQAQKKAASAMDINALKKQFNIIVSPKIQDDDEKKVNQSPRNELPDTETDVNSDDKSHTTGSQRH